MLVLCDDISSVSGERYEELFGQMPEERKERVGRRRLWEDRAAGVLAFALLAEGLREHGIDPGTARFERDAHGKPHLVGHAVEFNLSHSRGAVACAISERPVGVDIQARHGSDEKLRARVCSAAEAALIEASPDPDGEFTRLWTLKESLLKCRGTGLAGDLAALDFADRPSSIGARRAPYHLAICERASDGSFSFSDAPLASPLSELAGPDSRLLIS